MDFKVITEMDLDEFWGIITVKSGKRPSNEELVASVSDARSRFKLVDERGQVEFKASLVTYVENYAYLTQILDYAAIHLEKLYFFGRRLLPLLPDTTRTIPQSLKDDVAVKYIELKKTFEGSVKITDFKGQFESNISGRVSKSPDIVAVLSELILRINQEYSGRPITESETVCIEKLVNSIVHDDSIVSHFREAGNSVDDILRFSSFKDEFNEKLAKVLMYNEELYVNIKNNDAWRKKLLETIAIKVKETISQAGELDLPVISDNIPRNKESYRKALESCQQFLWLEDRFLNAELLTLCEDIIQNPQIQTIQILTSLVYNSGINEEFLNKVKEFKTTLSKYNVNLEVKIASTRRLHNKFHDRYVLGSNILWNLPPASSVFDGKSSQFKPFQAGTSNYEMISKDYVDWWNDPDALEIISKWSEIKKCAEYLSAKFHDKGKLYDLNCCICGKAIKLNFVPPKPYCYEHLQRYKNKR